MTVLNKHHLGGQLPPGAVNVMRGTPFGNPFVLGRDGDRAEVVAKYKAWLWRRIREDAVFAAQVRSLHGRALVCCCAPKACHADVLVAASAWLASAFPGDFGLPDPVALSRDAMIG